MKIEMGVGLLFPKLTETFLAIEDNSYSYKVARRCEALTYAYVSKLVKSFKKLGLIKLKLKGSKRIINLTPKGKKVQFHLREIIKYVS